MKKLNRINLITASYKFGLIRCNFTMNNKWFYNIWTICFAKKKFLLFFLYVHENTQHNYKIWEDRKKKKKYISLDAYRFDTGRAKVKRVEEKPIIRHRWWWTTYNSGVKDHHHHHHQLYCAQFNADKKSGYDKTCMRDGFVCV